MDMKILAVDDELLFCELLSAALKEIGYTDAKYTTSAKQALEFLSVPGNNFDCFLVDIQMAPMNGIELVRRIRAIERFRYTPIIMITANAEKASIDNAFLAGANDYITKPLKPVELQARLSMAASLAEARRQTQLLNQSVVDSDDGQSVSFAFDKPYLIDEPDCLTSVMAIENYLLKLGNIRLKSSAAVGFRVANARGLLDEFGGVDFSDIMADTATVISSALGRTPHLLAYTGSGLFVAVTNAKTADEWENVRWEVADMISQLGPVYEGAGLRLPDVVMGKPATVRLLSLEKPTKMITRAIASARKAIFSDSNKLDQSVYGSARKYAGVIG